MTQTDNVVRLRLSAGALVVAGILFALYPAIRPFSDEASLQGAAAFASTRWLVAHTLGMGAFILMPLGLLGFHSSLRGTSVERLGFFAVVLSILGAGLTLPFYGGEAFGLHAIGQEALRQQSPALVGLADVVRSGAGLLMGAGGLLLLAAAVCVVAVAIWRSGRYSKWSGVPLAVGIVLYIPQFFGPQALRVAHGLFVFIGCCWIGAGMWNGRVDRHFEDI